MVRALRPSGAVRSTEPLHSALGRPKYIPDITGYQTGTDTRVNPDNANTTELTLVDASVWSVAYVKTIGRKQYEFTDHLGNVLVTTADIKKGIDANSDGVTDYYHAHVLTTSDYYPFGMPMMDRYSYATTTAKSYRFGFNGQEKDNEVYGEGNSYTAEYWQYDPRLGRRWNVDPMTSEYAWQSPYSAFNNNPVYFADPAGLEGTNPEEQAKGKIYDNSWSSSGHEYEVVATRHKWMPSNFNEILDAYHSERMIYYEHDQLQKSLGGTPDEFYESMKMKHRRELAKYFLDKYVSSKVGGWSYVPIVGYVKEGIAYDNAGGGHGYALQSYTFATLEGVTLAPDAALMIDNIIIKMSARTIVKEVTTGTMRVHTFGAGWQTASLEKAILKHAGPKATYWVAKSGKLIIENPATGRQIVVDQAGYFRIFQHKSFGSKKGVYLDLMGRVPATTRFVKGGRIKAVLLEGDALDQATHFLIR